MIARTALNDSLKSSQSIPAPHREVGAEQYKHQLSIADNWSSIRSRGAAVARSTISKVSLVTQLHPVVAHTTHPTIHAEWAVKAQAYFLIGQSLNT